MCQCCFDVGWACREVALMDNGSAVGGEGSGMEAYWSRYLTFKAFAGLELTNMFSCKDETCRMCVAFVLIVVKLAAGCALGYSIELEGDGYFQAYSKEQKFTKCIVSIVTAYNGSNRWGCFFPHLLLWLWQPVGEALEGESWVEMFNLLHVFIVSLLSGRDGEGNVRDNYLLNLDHLTSFPLNHPLLTTLPYTLDETGPSSLPEKTHASQTPLPVSCSAMPSIVHFPRH